MKILCVCEDKESDRHKCCFNKVVALVQIRHTVNGETKLFGGQVTEVEHVWTMKVCLKIILKYISRFY